MRTLIRGRHVICQVRDDGQVEAIENGAVLVADGRIIEVGKASDLCVRADYDTVEGSDRHIVLPGFVNGHHHVGLTPLQLGSLDQPLELWWATRIAGRDVDPYLDTLYSAFEMLESGVTTVQHIFAWPRRDLTLVRDTIERVLQAYKDVGMRVSFSMAMRDQNRGMLFSDEDVLGSLPPELAGPLGERIAEFTVPLDEQLRLFGDLHAAHRDDPRVRIQLAPGNLHWCSDTALAALQDCSETFAAPLHIHLLETAYQKEYALRRTGGSALKHLQRFGMAGPHVTIGHGVWMSEQDVELAAETGTNVCHNCSSNLRLRSGVAPVNRLQCRGVNVALGIDEAGLNDDRDMLQEMRLVLKLHREPGMEDNVPTSPQVFRMATRNGALTTPFRDDIGTIAAGKAADLTLLKWDEITYPYLDPAITPLDAVLHRAKSGHVDTVLVEGEVVLRNGATVKIDKPAVLAEIAAALAVPLKPAEEQRRALARDLIEPTRRLYQGYIREAPRHPFMLPSSRV